MENPDQQETVRKSLRYSVSDGACHAAMLGFGESFFSAFAVFLKASNVQLGLLGSLPLLAGSLSQFLSGWLLKKLKSRKTLVSSAAFAQALFYIPIALVFFMGPAPVDALIVFVCLYFVSGMVLGPAWNSWMGDLVSEKARGKYFGIRSKVTGAATFSATLCAGYILHQFAGVTAYTYTGFLMIFMIAMLFRLGSFGFLRKKYEPPYEISHQTPFGFLEFLRESRFRNYGRFVLFLCFMNFSVYLSAPFVVPYMLKDLRLDYMTFTMVNAAALVVKFLAMPVWGRASDRFGTKKVLSLSGYLMPVVPLLWVFSGNVAYLVAVQIFSGFIWAGFELASFNFVFDTTTPEKRATGVAYYNVLNGLAIFAGAVLGGLIVRHNEIFWSKYLFVFVLSFALRYAASLMFLPRLREVRHVEAIPYPKLFFKIVSTMPTMGPVYSLIPFVRRIARKGDK